MRGRRLLVVLLALVLPLASCGNKEKAQQKAMEKALAKALEKQSGGKVDIDVDKGKMQIKTKDGEMTVDASAGAKLPEGFPKDVLVYKGAKIVTSIRQQKMFMLALQTGDAPDKVLEAYKKKMTDEGWEEVSSMDMGAQKMRIYKKGKRTTSLGVGQADGKTMIQLTTAPE